MNESVKGVDVWQVGGKAIDVLMQQLEIVEHGSISEKETAIRVMTAVAEVVKAIRS